MTSHQNKIVGEGLTYDDVLLVPAYSEILPREVSIQSKFTKNISINVPIISAAMDTVTESRMAIAMAREGGIGVLHKNMTIEQQALEVRKVKRAESGMIIDPVTLPLDAKVIDAKNNMREHSIGGIPIVDDNGKLLGIVTNRDLRFEKDNDRAITEVMTSHTRNLDFPVQCEGLLVFMLIFRFFNLGDFFYISGRVTMSTLRILVCPSVARQNEIQIEKLLIDFQLLYTFGLSELWSRKI